MPGMHSSETITSTGVSAMMSSASKGSWAVRIR